MTIAALIPFKDLAQAKSRLAQVLAESQRQVLARRMLDHVVAVLRSAPDIGSVTILSPTQPEGLAGTKWLRDQGRGLNPEIQDASTVLDARHVLIIHADLPNVAADDIRALIAAKQGHDISVAPDKAGTGTNALLLSPDRGFRFAFGPNSFQKHQQEAAARALSLGIVSRPGLSLDIDDPADLAAAGLTET